MHSAKQLFKASSRGQGSRKFKASLTYTEFQTSQSHIERPCETNKKTRAVQVFQITWQHEQRDLPDHLIEPPTSFYYNPQYSGYPRFSLEVALVRKYDSGSVTIESSISNSESIMGWASCCFRAWAWPAFCSALLLLLLNIMWVSEYPSPTI